MEVEGFEPPQEEVILVRRFERTHRALDHLCLNVEAEEHSLGDLNEPTSYKASVLDSESNKWIQCYGMQKIQSMRTTDIGMRSGNVKVHNGAKFARRSMRARRTISFGETEELRYSSWKWISTKRQKNQAKMNKTEPGKEKTVQNQAKVQKCQSQSQYRRISSQTGAGTEEYYWMQS
ncbi:hypothetical protein Tco_1533068 [Tanacetum coccineum]